MERHEGVHPHLRPQNSHAAAVAHVGVAPQHSPRREADANKLIAVREHKRVGLVVVSAGDRQVAET